MAKKKKQTQAPLEAGTDYAVVENDITIPFFSDILEPQDEVLLTQAGGKGLKLYDEIARDGHVQSVLQKRIQKLIGREWTVAAGGDSAVDVEAADFIKDVVSNLPFDDNCKNLLDATNKGFAVGELSYIPDGRHIRIERIKDIDQRRFVFDKDWNPRLLTMQQMIKGEELPARKFVVHRFGAKGNNPYGQGLGATLFWAVMFKRNGVAYWQKFLERFASPIPVGEYPVGSSPDVQAALMALLKRMNHASAITIPFGTKLDSFEAKRSGTVDYDAWVKQWNAEISKTVLGETLTTEMGSTGARAASETHADILDSLVDSDADLLSGTLNASMVKWLVEFNYPGAKLPKIWRARPSNEHAEEELKEKRAKRRSADVAALKEAREQGYEPEDLDAYMDDAFGTKMRRIVTGQKKTSELAFSAPESFALQDILRAVELKAAETHREWIGQLKTSALLPETADEVRLELLNWHSRLVDENPYASNLGDAIALAELLGRSEVMDELGDAAFADPTVGTVTFKEAQEFLRQKVSLPTKTWTDTLHQAHDRAFVIAGADSVSLVEDIRGALDRAINGGGGLEAFRAEFDEIIERTGWQYNGGRNWRTRVIYETNLRTAHQAGRLKQMRDPDVVKLRPYWRYIHAETREPKQPRHEHLAWDGMVFRYDDPIWDVIFPPNGWRCSCGVGTVSQAGMKRLGKTGPDTPPKLKMRRKKDPTTGEWVKVPEGIDFGWGYQPGNTWEQGLVPLELQKPLSHVQPELKLGVLPPVKDLGKPYATAKLPSGKETEFYIDKFLERFGAARGQAALFRDPAGQAVVISDELFRNTRNGQWKAMKRGREVHLEQLAETIFDPAEIWVDWEIDQKTGFARLTRRYLRWDADLAGITSFTWSPRGWSGVTSFGATAGRAGKPSVSGLEKQRHGVLIYRRK